MRSMINTSRNLIQKTVEVGPADSLVQTAQKEHLLVGNGKASEASRYSTTDYNGADL